MQRRLLPCLLSVMLSCASGQVTAANQSPKTIQDLSYGDVLFHFYKEDYFTAITRLMSVLDRNMLKHHAKDGELLLGGLELSYGLPNEAEKQFQRTIDDSIDTNVSNRSWYFLGKSAYQHGDYEQARNALNHYQVHNSDALITQRTLLLANTEMSIGNNQAAVELLRATRAGIDDDDYLAINRGIALLRNGELEAGRKVLDELGLIETNDPELRSLRDRANLSLGYELLRAKQPEIALVYLNRVRLNGPYAEPALLGAGWADATLGDFNNALTPWLELIERDTDSPAIQEAHLAVPFAFEKLADDARAIHYYESAIRYYDKAQINLKNAVQSVETEMLSKIITQLPSDFSGGWLHNNTKLEGLPGAAYLIEILASNEFQEHLKNYRDLAFLDQQLARWARNIKPLHDVVDTLRLANEQRSPKVRKLLETNAAKTLEMRLANYRQKIELLDKQPDPFALATTKELEQLHRLESVKKRIATYKNIPNQQQLLDKTHRLKGILAWQIETDYQTRLIDIKKLLAEAEDPIRDAQINQARVARVLKNVGIGFSGDDNFIKQLQIRIERLQPAVQQTLNDTGAELKLIVLKALKLREDRLISYRNQAHYALARGYDRLSQQVKAEADEAGQ